MTDASPHVFALRCPRFELPIGEKTYVMGIVNLTPDSFSGDGVGRDVPAAVERAKRLVAEGADIVDIGAESARADVPVADPREEIAAIVPVVERLSRETDVLISVDTYKPVVAEAAVRAGAHIVNDIGGFKYGTGTAEVAARYGAALVLNYTYERPKVRPSRPPVYADLIAEHLAFLQERIEMALRAGMPEEALIVDPGIAFGKSHDEDLEVLRSLDRVRALGRPLLVAASRKHFIGAVLGLPPQERVEGTAAVVALAIARGADIVRVHDVRAMSRVARMADAIVRGRLGDYAPGEGSWPWPAGVTPLT
jgi:dihydropteroate synthase